MKRIVKKGATPVVVLSQMKPLVIKESAALDKEKVRRFLLALGIVHDDIVYGFIDVLDTMVQEEKKAYHINDIVKRAIAIISNTVHYNRKEVRSITEKISRLLKEFMKSKEVLITPLIEMMPDYYFVSSKVKCSRLLLLLSDEEKGCMRELLSTLEKDEIPFLSKKRRTIPHGKKATKT